MVVGLCDGSAGDVPWAFVAPRSWNCCFGGLSFISQVVLDKYSSETQDDNIDLPLWLLDCSSRGTITWNFYINTVLRNVMGSVVHRVLMKDNTGH